MTQDQIILSILQQWLPLETGQSISKPVELLGYWIAPVHSVNGLISSTCYYVYDAAGVSVGFSSLWLSAAEAWIVRKVSVSQSAPPVLNKSLALKSPVPFA